MLFPTVCVDGFFDNPKEVRDLAYSLKKGTDIEGAWPGKRTAPLHQVAPEYNNFFVSKLFSLFYDYTKQEVQWDVDSYFQFIEPYHTKQENNIGWVHRDKECVLAGVIYLNENPEITAGTSLYARKFIGAHTLNEESKCNFYKNKNNENEEVYLKKLHENNNQFIETLTVGNVYNRLICYDGSHFHKANNFVCGNEPRLTQVFFVKKIMADWFPIPSMRAM